MMSRFLFLTIYLFAFSTCVHYLNAAQVVNFDRFFAGRDYDVHDDITTTESPFPTFSNQYYVEGVLSLPYAEIKEPFRGFYDQPNGRSRVDYYGDLVQTVQRIDLSSQQYGIGFKLAYTVDTNGDPRRGCFQINGSQEAPVETQSVLPDLSFFKLYGQEKCPVGSFEARNRYQVKISSDDCERWTHKVINGDKENNYAFWLTRDSDGSAIPVAYVMKGYDSLLGSHYDKYEISYKNYRAGPIDEKYFDIPSNITCTGFPGPGMEHVALNNPIKEFVANHDQHVKDEFSKFAMKHGRKYVDQLEQRMKENVFRHNFRFIMSHNRKMTQYKVAVNHLADFTTKEMRRLRGKIFTGVKFNGGKHFDHKSIQPSIKLPTSWDWRLNGAVTPVKDQAVCGSCWSFGTVGTIEGQYFVKTGHLVRFSEQQLIDCSWNQGDNGCDGGEDFRAYDYIIKHGGLATEEEYGSYIGQDGKCHDKDENVMKKVVKLDGFYNVTSGSPNALKIALFKNGPVTIAIDASHKSLSFYSSGVYYEPQCGSQEKDLDHQVLAVGYGTLQGEDYWLVKNSWSTYWGNDGYVLMNQKNNNCGVLTQPTFPIIAD